MGLGSSCAPVWLVATGKPAQPETSAAGPPLRAGIASAAAGSERRAGLGAVCGRCRAWQQEGAGMVVSARASDGAGETSRGHRAWEG